MKKEYSDEKKIKIRFRGNYQEFIYGEIYELDEKEAMPYVVLGYATIEEK